MCGGDGRRVLAVELVGLEDGVAVPVAPVHPVLEEGDAERMLQHVRRIKHDPGKSRGRVRLNNH